MFPQKYHAYLVIAIACFFNTAQALQPRQSLPWVKRYKKIITPEFLKKRLHGKSKNEIVIKVSTIPFDQLMFSWNAVRPHAGHLSFYVSVRERPNKKWLAWHKMFEWGHAIQRSYPGSRCKGSSYKFVRLLMKRHYADAFKIKIKAYNGARLDQLKALCITVCRIKHMTGDRSHDIKKKLITVYVKNVPKISQRELNHTESHRLCSPTSTCMLVSYLKGKVIDPIRFANNVYDEGLKVFGSWPFNTAHAFEHCPDSHFIFATRLADFKELHAYLCKKIPIVVSVRGHLRNAPKTYPNGHLLIVVGYDSKTNEVICHDPAQYGHENTLTRYALTDFLRCWHQSHKLAYITSAVATQYPLKAMKREAMADRQSVSQHKPSSTLVAGNK